MNTYYKHIKGNMKLHSDSLIIAVVVLVLISFAFTVSAATMVKGNITTNTFTRSGNPYIVIEDIYIPENGSVVIPAGVVLLFSNLTGFKVMGSLSVEGTEDEPVTFSSVYDIDYKHDAPHLASPDDWNGIFITQQAGYILFRNVKIKYSTYGITSRKPDVIIENCWFAENTKNMDIVDCQYSQVKDNEPFSNIPKVEPSSIKEETLSVAEAPDSTVSPVGLKDTTGGMAIAVFSEAASVVVDSSYGKTQRRTRASFSQLFNYNNHDNDILLLRKRVRLSLMGAMALGGAASWIVNHVRTENHLKKMDEYSNMSRSTVISPGNKLKAQTDYTTERDLREKSIQRVNASAGITIGLCTGIGLTLLF
ncbi:MAG: hypothetical protein JW915_14100 [Chitinispirillaceae bacterium]|nr:hypothetical protein [Chitinispirillaceae bacterium]